MGEHTDAALWNVFFIYLHIETSSVPQRLVLGPVLFSIFVSDMDSKIECTFSKFATATTTELCTVVDVLKGMDVIQSDLDRPVRWACAKPHEFQQSQVQDPAHESRQSSACVQAGKRMD